MLGRELLRFRSLTTAVVVLLALASLGGCARKKSGAIALVPEVVILPPRLDSLAASSEGREIRPDQTVVEGERLVVVGRGTPGVEAELQAFGRTFFPPDSGDGTYRQEIVVPAPGLEHATGRISMVLRDKNSDPPESNSRFLSVAWTVKEEKPSGPTPAERLDALAKQMAAAPRVYFGFDLAVIPGAELPKVARWQVLITDALALDGSLKFEVRAGCDHRGPEPYNLQLGKQRAVAVAEELVRLGVPKDALVTVSLGHSKAHTCSGLEGDALQQCYAEDRNAAIVMLR